MNKFTSGQVGDDSPFTTKQVEHKFPAVMHEVLKPDAKPVPIEKAKVLRIDVQNIADDDLLNYRLAVDEHLEELSLVKFNIDKEIRRRLNARNARSLIHPGFERIELKDEYTEYVYDQNALAEARSILKEAGKDEEANKVCKLVKEQVTVIPEHWEHGNPRSINALRLKYGEDTPLGEALKKAMNRESLGAKLDIKKKPPVAIEE